MMHTATECTKNEQHNRATIDFLQPGNTMTPDELREVLTDLGINQSQLAAMLDVTEKTVSFWINDKSPIPSYVALIVSLMRDNSQLRTELEDAKQRIVAHFFTTPQPRQDP